jgi:hypothetical protein
MRIACCIPKATYTHSEYIILIDFPRQQWLRERASMLRYTYITCLVSLRSKCSTRQVRNVLMLFGLRSGSKGLMHSSVPDMRNCPQHEGL